MSVQRVASRYARSVIELAEEQQKLEKVHEDMQGFVRMLEVSHDFELLVKSPVVNTSIKGKIFSALLEGKIDELSMQFFKVVLRKGRESYLPEIAREFLEQYKALKGISTVRLRSAISLDEGTLATIRKKLSDSDVARQQIELITETDESLIGGFVLEYGDKLYDASVAYQLKQLAEEIGGK